MTYGTVSLFDTNATVRFDRVLATPIDRVWQSLTDESQLSEWLAPCRFEAGIDGSVCVDFGEGQKVDGIVTDFEPPHRLEYTWIFTEESDSVLLFELEQVGAQTRMVLEHRMLPAEQAAGYGAGWHAHLDMLGALLEGTQPVDWDERFSAVLGKYAGA